MASPGISYEVAPTFSSTTPPAWPGGTADTCPGPAPAGSAVTATRPPVSRVRTQVRPAGLAAGGWLAAAARAAEDAGRAAACGAADGLAIAAIAVSAARLAAIAADARGRGVTLVSLG